MRSQLEAAAGGYTIYTPRRNEFDTHQEIPFRVSPKPLELSASQKKEIETIGSDITSYYLAVDQLYHTNANAQALLDKGKPEIFCGDEIIPTHYLFIRPDIIITPKGFSICEVEVSPFGLALAEMLNRAYRNEGFETMVADGTLPAFVRANTPIEGTIIYSKKPVNMPARWHSWLTRFFPGKPENGRPPKRSV